MEQPTFDNLIRYSLRHRNSFWGAFRQGLRRQQYGPEYGGESYHSTWIALPPGIERIGYLTGFDFKGGTRNE